MRRRKHTAKNYFQEAVIQSLVHLKKDDPERFIDVISLPAITGLFSSEKLEWLGSEKSLRVFFDLLKVREKISCEWESFKSLFIGPEPINKQTWNSEINELIYLIDCFRDEGTIRKHKTPHKQLQKLFLNKYGESLESKIIASTLYKGIRREDIRNDLEDIIKAVLKAKSGG